MRQHLHRILNSTGDPLGRTHVPRPRPSRIPNNTRVDFKTIKAFTLNKYFDSNTHIYYGTVAPIISSIVIVVNILLIFTLVKGKFRMSTHVMMVSMAIADTLTGLAPLPFNIYIFGFEKGVDYLTLPWCYIHEYMLMILPEMFHTCSLHLTVGLGIERFIVLAFPLKAKRICTFRNGIIFSIAIFTISMCTQIDRFTQVTFESFSVRSRVTNNTRTGCIRSEKVRSNTEFIVRVMFMVFVPCLTLAIFTILLLRKSGEIQKWRRQNIATGQQKSSFTQSLERIDTAVICIMIFIVISEVAVWTCLLLSRVNNIRFTKTNAELRAIGFIVFQITSPLNFIVLCFLSSKFREVIKKSLCCCWRSNKCLNCIYKGNNQPPEGSTTVKTENIDSDDDSTRL